jgi:hypothetical protein
MSEEAPAIVGIAALAIDCTDPPGLARWWQRRSPAGGGAVAGCWPSCRLLHRRDDRPHQGVQVVAVAATR